MDKTQKRADGDCFPVAYNLLHGFGDERLQLFEDDATVIQIVHGLPVRRGPEGAGRRFWHAWIEITRMIEIPPEVAQAHPEFAALGDEIVVRTVIDRSNGQDVTIPRAAYYALGDLDDEHVWRFTPEEAREQVLTREHYGPWVDDWEGMGD